MKVGDLVRLKEGWRTDVHDYRTIGVIIKTRSPFYVYVHWIGTGYRVEAYTPELLEVICEGR